MTAVRRPALWYTLALACGAAGCGPPRDADGVSTRFEDARALVRAVRQADRVVLYEGLPHPTAEPRLFEQERQKPTVTLHGHPFYAAPPAVARADRDELQRTLGDFESYKPWTGGKRGAEFHPDYLAEFWVGEVPYRVLVGFAGHEVKVFGPDANVRCDIDRRMRDRWRELLDEFRRQRPAADAPPAGPAGKP